MDEGKFSGGAVVSVRGGAPTTVRAVYRNERFRVDAVPFESAWGPCIHVMVQSTVAAPILWADKQALKNEIIGPHRLAIEVFPPESELVDQAEVFHLWVLPDGFKLPFGLEET